MQSRATKMLRITKGGSHELNDVHCTDDWVTKKKIYTRRHTRASIVENEFLILRIIRTQNRTQRKDKIYRHSSRYIC